MNVSRILATKSSDVVTIRPHQRISEALKLLAEYDIGALVVTNDEDDLVGILSERDIVRRAVQEEDPFALQVADVMTKKCHRWTAQR